MSNAAGGGQPMGRDGVVAELARLEELEVTIEKLVMGGDGLARHRGIPIFVPRSVPGDRLRVRLVQRRPHYARAAIAAVLEAGPGRREPPCPHFERCGGCDLQQIEDGLQAPLKAAAVAETLRRLGGLELPPPEIVTGAAWGYRLRAQLHTEPAVEGAPEVGYYARGSRDLVPVASCPILVPQLERALAGLAPALPASPPRRLDLAAGDGDGWTAAPLVPGLPRGPVRLAAGGFVYQYDARVFFQVHAGLVARLIELAVGAWEGELAMELYAGVGLLTLPLARRYRRVQAVESDPVAVRFARMNARRNGVDGVEVLKERAETAIEQLPLDADRLVLDPPRTGLSGELCERILDRRPRRLTYVSCDPPTLARDLRRLTDVYHVERWAVLDLFPQTGHMEVVAQLRPHAEDGAGAAP